jgi:surfeit locus 1 family protein
MVNRGWVPFEGYRDRLPEVRLTSTEETVRVSGLLDELPVAGLAGGRAGPALSGKWPRVTAYPQPAELARSLGVDSKRLESRVLLLDASAPDGYRRDWKPYAKGPEQNWSYAIQWWSFAVLLLVLFVIMNLKKRDTE